MSYSGTSLHGMADLALFGAVDLPLVSSVLKS